MTDIELAIVELSQKVEHLENENDTLIKALSETQEALGTAITKLIRIESILQEGGM